MNARLAAILVLLLAVVSPLADDLIEQRVVSENAKTISPVSTARAIGHLLLELAHFRERVLLGLPDGLHAGGFLAQLGELLLEI